MDSRTRELRDDGAKILHQIMKDSLNRPGTSSNQAALAGTYRNRKSRTVDELAKSVVVVLMCLRGEGTPGIFLAFT